MNLTNCTRLLDGVVLLCHICSDLFPLWSFCCWVFVWLFFFSQYFVWLNFKRPFQIDTKLHMYSVSLQEINGGLCSCFVVYYPPLLYLVQMHVVLASVFLSVSACGHLPESIPFQNLMLWRKGFILFSHLLLTHVSVWGWRVFFHNLYLITSNRMDSLM